MGPYERCSGAMTINHVVVIDPADEVFEDHRGKRTVIALDETPVSGTILSVCMLDGLMMRVRVKQVALLPCRRSGLGEGRLNVPHLLVGSDDPGSMIWVGQI